MKSAVIAREHKRNLQPTGILQREWGQPKPFQLLASEGFQCAHKVAVF